MSASGDLSRVELDILPTAEMEGYVVGNKCGSVRRQRVRTQVLSNITSIVISSVRGMSHRSYCMLWLAVRLSELVMTTKINCSLYHAVIPKLSQNCLRSETGTSPRLEALCVCGQT